MALIQACPKNQNEVIEASRKLGCGYDKYGNNQYLCLPNKEKTSLIEFCSDGVMGIRDKGICLEANEGKLIQHNCHNFSDGCPDTEFYDYDFYKYPACQNINTELNCYVADPLCGPKPFLEESFSFYPIGYALGGLMFFTIICIIAWCCWRRNCRKENPKAENDAEMEFLSNDPKAENDAEMEFLSNAESPLQIIQSGRTCVDVLRVKKGKAMIHTYPDSGITNFPLCFHCNSPLRGSLVNVLGKTWCPEHFICQYNGCGRNLVDIGFYEKEGVLYCEQHLALICNMCGNPIKEEYVMAQQKTYHSACFICYTCKNPICGSAFQHEDGTFYCENHTHKEVCKGCNKSIDPTVTWVEAMQSAYHPKCFNCTTCGVSLVNQPHCPKGGKPYCKLHYWL